MNQKTKTRVLYLVLTVCALCFYVGWLAVITRQNPDYLRDFHAAVNPDAQTYVQLGANIWQNSEYSRNPNPPYRPDFKWTPVFPLLAGAAWCCGGVGGILVMNVLLTLATAALLARMVWDFTHSRRSTLFVFLCPLLDPLLWSLNLQAMSDVAFLFFLTLGATFLKLGIRNEELGIDASRNVNVRKSSTFGRSLNPRVSVTPHSTLHTPHLIFAALSFSLAILTRPTGLYVPVVLLLAAVGGKGLQMMNYELRIMNNQSGTSAFLPGKNLSEGHVTRSVIHNSSFIIHNLIFLFAAYFPVVCWMARNELVFGKFALSGNQNIVMVYYTGGGAWQMAEGGTLEEAQKRIEEEFHLPPCVVCHNPEAFGADPAEIDAKLAAAKRSVLLRHPKALILSSGIGVVKSLLAHETQTLEEITRSEKLGFVFVWSLIFQGTILLLTTCSILFRLPSLWHFTKQNPTFMLAILGLTAYFLLTMMLSGMDCCARYRLPLMPVFYVASGIWFFGPFRRR